MRFAHPILRPDYLESRSIRRTLTQVVPRGTGRLLDVGCGDRRYLDLFDADQYVGLEHPGAGATNSDLAPNVWGDALRLPFADQSFDTVLSTQTLEHLKDPFVAFAEMHRVTKVGGRLVVSAPQTWPEHFSPHDYFRFTRFGLAELARRAGYEVETIVTRGGMPTLVATLLATRLYARAGMRNRWLGHLVRPICAALLTVALISDRRTDDTATLGYVMRATRSR